MEIKDELPFWSAPFGLVLLDTIRIRPGMRVLDIGSGSGFPMLEIAARLGRGSAVAGLDPSEYCVEMIRAKIGDVEARNADVVKGVAEEIPFKEATFDLITSNNGMNNVQDMERAFSECYRVCKPGGQFVFTVNLPHTFTEFYEAMEQEFSDRHLEDGIRRIRDHIFEKRKPVEYLQELSLKTGFRIISSLPDAFRYRFCDADAFFTHPLISNFFLPRRLELIPDGSSEDIVRGITERLDRKVTDTGWLEMSVPFVCFDLAR
jgi:arsenite methyltransferase